MEHQTTRSARVIRVIETISIRGKGDEGNVVREVTQYWSLDGRALAEHDPTVDVMAATIKVEIGETFGHGSEWIVNNPPERDPGKETKP